MRWRYSRFFQSWIEYVRYHLAGDAPDFEFENLVERGMEAYPVTGRFMTILDVLLSSDPGTVEWARGN